MNFSIVVVFLSMAAFAVAAPVANEGMSLHPPTHTHTHTHTNPESKTEN